jgi:hypothetical protein
MTDILSPDGLGLIDQHDGNVITNFIFQPAGIANKPILLFCQFEFALALRAYEYVKQVRLNWHNGLPVDMVSLSIVSFIDQRIVQVSP